MRTFGNRREQGLDTTSEIDERSERSPAGDVLAEYRERTVAVAGGVDEDEDKPAGLVRVDQPGGEEDAGENDDALGVQ